MSNNPYSWTAQDSAAAAAEGWDLISWTAGEGKTGETLEIHYVDDKDLFTSDAAALMHVYAKALDGSYLHQKALQLSLQSSPAFVPPRIGINFTGGVIQSVFSDAPAELMVIDYETDMVDEDRIVTLTQDDGSESEAYAQIFGVDIMPGEYDKYAPTIHAAELERNERDSMSP